jgi:hypothetical protein
MSRTVSMTLIALLGLAAGNAHADYCKVSTYTAGNLSLYNHEYAGILMRADNQIRPLHDPLIGCTMSIPVRPLQERQEVVTDVPARSLMNAFTHFVVPPMSQPGYDDVTFRRVVFRGTDAIRRELTFRLVLELASEISLPSTMIVATYTETSPTGKPLLEERVRFEHDGSSAMYWMRVDWATNSGTTDTSRGSALQIRFIESESMRVLAGTKVELAAGVAPGTIHQGMLGSNGVYRGTLSLCTASADIPAVSGRPVPLPSTFGRICRT